MIYSHRALQLLNSALNLTTEQLSSGVLKPSDAVKSGKCIHDIPNKILKENIAINYTIWRKTKKKK